MRASTDPPDRHPTDPSGRYRAASMVDIPSLAPLPTATERAAEIIRDSIFEGRFPPGAALPETSLAGALQVSRNTVREAYRTLVNEHLLTYEPHRGVTVRSLTADDVRDIYRLRRMLELAALDLLASGAGRLDLVALGDGLTEADRAAGADDWVRVGTANLRFHTLLVAAHDSPRVDELFRRLMTEMRLGFLALADPRAFHEPYLRRNHRLAELFRTGGWAEARTELDRYLDDAQRQVLAAVEAGR